MGSSNSVPLPLWPDILWGSLGILVVAALVAAVALLVMRSRRD